MGRKIKDFWGKFLVLLTYYNAELKTLHIQFLLGFMKIKNVEFFSAHIIISVISVSPLSTTTTIPRTAQSTPEATATKMSPTAKH